MNEDIKIIDLYAYNNDNLKEEFKQGYKIQLAIPYVQKFFNYRQVYSPNGTSYEEKYLESEKAMIKYILTRDGISRNVYG